MNPLNHFTHPPQIFSREQVNTKPCPVPAQNGIYGWYFKQIPPGVPVEGCIRHDSLTLLYIGIAPSSSNSLSNLRKRIKQHYNRNAYGSTLRRTLGCLLSGQLNIKLQGKPGSKRFTFGAGEEILSDWMSRNAYVTWLMHGQPWQIEHDLIQGLHTPLNLDGNHSHPFFQTLKEIRKTCKNNGQIM